MILISAPAGYGKTTLLCEWLATCGQPSAWISLDKGDNDPARFWAYWQAALQRATSSVENSIPDILHNYDAPTVEALLIDALVPWLYQTFVFGSSFIPAILMLGFFPAMIIVTSIWMSYGQSAL